MRVCYLGEYQLDYARNWVIRQGLVSQGIQVIPCQIDPPPVAQPLPVLRRWGALLRRFCATPGPWHAIVVAEANQAVMPLAWALARLHSVPVIFDPFYSQYDTLVCDRRVVEANSWHAAYLLGLDRLAINLADHVLADTDQHRLYYQTRFRMHGPISVIPIGANNRVFYPRPTPQGEYSQFQIIFWGTFIPLQGIQYILKAAYILQERGKPVHFNIAGSGQTLVAMRQMVKDLNLLNVTFLGPIPAEQLPSLIQRADLALGIFGDTAKAQRVVPNKVYEGLAMAKPVITGDSPAIKEFFTPGEHLHTVSMGDPKGLADAILFLARDEEYRRHLARHGYERFSASFTPEHISQQLMVVLKQLAIIS
jgi:glycosyltransferase involved in cell wall biosynthesis